MEDRNIKQSVKEITEAIQKLNKEIKDAIWNDIKSCIKDLNRKERLELLDVDRPMIINLICQLHNKVVDYQTQNDFKLKASFEIKERLGLNGMSDNVE